MFSKRLHVFIAGPQTSAQGIERKFSQKDLQQVVDTYDPKVHEAPLVIGHSGDNDSAPSFGWIKKFTREGDNLYADVDFTDNAKDLVKNGHYRKVSISFYSPESPINPHQGKWSARHLALLGASPPAVKGLEPFSFSEEGVFDFALTITPESLFDQELGPTLLVEKSPLEMLKDRFQEIKGEMDSALEELEETQENQTETNVEETTKEAEDSAPENPNQQFSEMKKKMGREGAETSESAQKLANLETMSPDDQYEEGSSRKKAKGAHGHEAQVVQEVFEEETIESKELPPSFLKNMEKMKKKAEVEEDDSEFAEEDLVTHKSSNKGEVSFRKSKSGKEDPSGRGVTGKSESDSYADRQAIGKGEPDGRENTSDDGGEQDRKRDAKGSSSAEDEDRVQTAKSEEEGRWAGQPEAKGRATNADQYDTGEEDLSVEVGTSEGKEPHGRDGGPTSVSDIMEEEPSNEEIVVPLESTKGNKKVRVLHQTSEDERAEIPGGKVADHAEGESDGLTKDPKEAKISKKGDPMGRSGGPTNFPSKSEEDPDDMELAVDLENSVDSSATRVMRVKAGEEASVEHGEKQKGPWTKTGKGSTYGQESPEMEDEEEDDDDLDEEELEEFVEELKFCGMGSMAQAKPMGFPSAMYEELMALKNENERLRKEYEEHKVRSKKAKIAEFIDRIYVEGKLTDGVIPQRELQSYCEGLEFGTLDFAEGESPTTKLFNLLDRLPNLVYFGEVVSNSPYEAPEEDLDPHERAMKMVESGEASDYVEAIKKCIPWGVRD